MDAEESGSSRSRSVGQASAAVAAVLFGTAYVATSVAIRSLTPLGAAMWRGLLSTAVLAAALAAARHPGPVYLAPGRIWRLIILGLSGGLGFVVAMNVAVSMTGATIAAFAASMSPVVAAVLAPVVLGEALTIPALGGFAAAAVGTALLSGTGTSAVDGLGVLAGVLAALCFAVFLLLSRRWSQAYRLTGGAIALSVAATTGLGLLPIELLYEPAQLVPQQIRPDAAFALIWLALVPGVAAQLFVIASVRRVKTQSSAALLLISPITASVLAAALLGETLDEPQLLGAALILGGVVVAAGLEVDSRLRAMPGRLTRRVRGG
ncbi:MAG: DMT family transporter [Candidatus Limnocylindrales bacterium]|jgi:drug/metabolite transporter (DMT)-like permease